MSVQFESENPHTETEPREGPSPVEDGAPEDGQELKITVRKLEVPVRPRGVLAE